MWLHRIIGLGPSLSLSTSALAARFFITMAESAQRPVLAFTVTSHDEWHLLAASDWTTLRCDPEQRSGWKILRRMWVTGYAHTAEKLAEVYRFAWMWSHNDPVIVVIASQDDRGELITMNIDDLAPGREHLLMPIYGTVAGRYFDGQWITVVSTRLDDKRARVALQRAADQSVPDRFEIATRRE